jgi:hypothetical protein
MNPQTSLFEGDAPKRVNLLRIFNEYREHHGEAPSKEAEKRRKGKRSAKALIVESFLSKVQGKTAGELWHSYSKTFQKCGMPDIYDLRRTLSMMKKVGLVRSGESRKCMATGVDMFPWYWDGDNL